MYDNKKKLRYVTQVKGSDTGMIAKKKAKICFRVICANGLRNSNTKLNEIKNENDKNADIIRLKW